MTTWITGSGLALTDVIEPRPTDEMQREFPADHERLSARPAFLLLAARRPAPPGTG